MAEGSLSNNRAVIKLSAHVLQDLLDLPEGMVVHHLYVHPPSDSVAVVVYSEDLPEQPWDCELPILEGNWRLTQLRVPALGADPEDPDPPMQNYYRWGWQRD